MEFRAARRSERDQVLDLLALWYNDREFFARYNQTDPTFRDELCLVAEDRGRLVSTVQIFDRRINLAAQAVPMGGIGSVFTREEYRHQNLASRLMELAVQTMEREGFEVSLLFAVRLSFYNQFGWKEVNRSFSVLPAAASLNVPGEFEMDAFDIDRDLADMMRIHDRYSGRFNVTAVRGEGDWRANLAFAGNMPADPVGGCEEYFVLARSGGKIAAYARATRFHGVAMVMEYGYSDPAAMLATFRHLGSVAESGTSPYPVRGDHRSAELLRPQEKGAGSMLVTHTRHDPTLERMVTEAGGSVAHHTDNNYMWLIVLPEKLGQRFGMSPQAAANYVFAMFEDPSSLYWTADRF
jgi:predicted N-acetyltransferase YhbS